MYKHESSHHRQTDNRHLQSVCGTINDRIKPTESAQKSNP